MAIVVDPDILHGKPVIKGTRISVDLLLELVDSGMSIRDILQEYPILKKEDVQVVLQIARKAHETVRYDKLKTATEA